MPDAKDGSTPRAATSLDTGERQEMIVWSLIVRILSAPGTWAVSLFPDLDDAHRRLLSHMVNYVFWLTPTVGLLIWLVIQHTLATLQY